MPRRRSADNLLKEIENRVDKYDLLSSDEKQEAIDRAKKHVAEQNKKKQIDALFEQAVSEENARFDPNEELLDIVIELGDYAPCITINGRMSYYHGLTYRVPRSLAMSLNDIMWQTQQHQREIDGKRRKGDVLRQPQHINISPASPHGRVTVAGNMRM